MNTTPGMADDASNTKPAIQSGVCPYCGNRELDYATGESDFSALSATKQVLCPKCGRTHQVQYRPVSLRVQDETADNSATRDVLLDGSHAAGTCSVAEGAQRFFFATPPVRARRIYWLVTWHAAASMVLPWFASRGPMDAISLIWLALLTTQVGLLGVWVGVGRPLMLARGVFAVAVILAGFYVVYASMRGGPGAGLIFMFIVFFVAAGAFAALDRLGYRIWLGNKNHNRVASDRLQFSILHLLALMTIIGALLAGAAVARWMHYFPRGELFLVIAVAVLNTLAMVILCWAVLGETQVALRLAMTVPMVPGFALLLLYSMDEWDIEAVVVIGGLACVVYGVLTLTFGVLRSAGYRYGWQPR
jgi:hypothetical protein